MLGVRHSLNMQDKKSKNGEKEMTELINERRIEQDLARIVWEPVSVVLPDCYRLYMYKNENECWSCDIHRQCRKKDRCSESL
jgi:hypothetical protein